MSSAGAALRIAIASKDHIRADGRTQRVIEKLDLSLAAGEAGAVVGPSGCGKSTLLRIVAGLDHAYDGKVEAPAQGRLGMVFQEPRLLPWRSVIDNLRIAAPHAAPQALYALLDELDLADHAGHFPGELSLGLARRAALARALAVEPELLLLDEPLVSLDTALARDLRDKIAALIDERRVTTLIVTHDLQEAIRLADRIFLLSPRPARVIATLEVETPRRAMNDAAAQALEQQARAMLARRRPAGSRSIASD